MLLPYSEGFSQMINKKEINKMWIIILQKIKKFLKEIRKNFLNHHLQIRSWNIYLSMY